MKTSSFPSGVGQRNLNILTVVVSLVWLFAIVLFAFTMDKPAAPDAKGNQMPTAPITAPANPTTPALPTSPAPAQK